VTVQIAKRRTRWPPLPILCLIAASRPSPLLDLTYGMTYRNTQGGPLDGQGKDRNIP